MTDIYQEPIFNLKAVVEETGVTADALRAWERRYGLPQPARTQGGHRVYSQHDVDIIKWLVARQKEGLRISRAIELWRNLTEEGQEPIPTIPPDTVTEAPGEAITLLREEWISSCLIFDEKKAEQVITQAFALYPLEMVCMQVLRRGIVDIGRGWYKGQITVQQEHFASELAMRQLETLVRATPPPTRRGRIMVAGPPEEKHALGLLLLVFLLQRSGWNILYLGTDVPQKRMKETVKTVEPILVILAAQQLHTAANLLQMTQTLYQEGISLAFGGGIFNRLPSLQDHIPARFLGSSLKEAPQTVEQITTRSPHHPSSVKTPSQFYREALTHYHARQPYLEKEVWEVLREMGIDHRTLTETNTQFAQAITGALTFGDIALLDSHLTWLEGMHNSIRVSTEILSNYLEAYHQAAEIHLDERGEPIRDWLSKRNKRNTSNDP